MIHVYEEMYMKSDSKDTNHSAWSIISIFQKTEFRNWNTSIYTLYKSYDPYTKTRIVRTAYVCCAIQDIIVYLYVLLDHVSLLFSLIFSIFCNQMRQFLYDVRIRTCCVHTSNSTCISWQLSLLINVIHDSYHSWQLSFMTAVIFDRNQYKMWFFLKLLTWFA